MHTLIKIEIEVHKNKVVKTSKPTVNFITIQKINKSKETLKLAIKK